MKSTVKTDNYDPNAQLFAKSHGISQTAFTPVEQEVEQEIARYLVENGSVEPGEIEHAIRMAKRQGISPWEMALRLGLISETDMATAFVRVLGLEPVSESESPASLFCDERLSRRFLRFSRAVPLQLVDGRLHLAMADPTDRFTQESIAAACGHPVVPRVALPSWIESTLARLDGGHRSAAEAISEGLEDGAQAAEDEETLKDLASEAPVIRLVNLLLQRALSARASDIHIEPFENRLRVRYRVDGMLLDAESLPPGSAAAVISRLKLMARLDIAERRLPQDGRFSLRMGGRELDLRVSTIPTLFGESLVIRLLDKEGVQLDFEALGFSGDARRMMLRMLDAPNGILLVTGPTGSGKSTTLYTALDRLNVTDRKIITVEDPVEYRLEGINQIQVKPQIGLHFATALRAIVRQDPDIIMVGEMRDQETARIAVQSALTGHLVLSTLHTNDAASAITRLLDMGIEPYLITATLNGIVAQRLVRRLCPHCAEPLSPTPEVLAAMAPEHSLPAGAEPRLRRAAGCDQCNHTGYLGRIALTEILCMDDSLRRLVLQRASADALRESAVAGGMVPLNQDGMNKALQGLTTLEEVARVKEF